MEQKIVIYTDGSSRGNPGPGGYGCILMTQGHSKQLSGGFRKTTNNRMELLAVIVGLEALKKEGLSVDIYSDSKYVCDSISLKWVDNWIRNNFKGDKKNPDLWKRYYALSKKFKVTMHWVKGHADNVFNNQCDILATTAADNKANHQIDTEYENLGKSNTMF